MSSHKRDLPCLPGYNFNETLGKTKFNLNPKFDFICKGVPALVEKVKPNIFGPISDRYPSIYNKGDVTDLPPWIAFDKQILCFDGICKEMGGPESPSNIRKVKVYFFLEDGTIQVVEPKVENSGIAQGTLITRHRIRFPGHMDDNFYELIDFNIGRDMEFYGRTFKLINCDKFTRNFLNRCGISVPDPILFEYEHSEETDKKIMKKPKEMRKLTKFLANDKKVLKFYGIWDDEKSEYGFKHELLIFFFLADDTVEVAEIDQTNKGKKSIFLKRGPLSKSYRERSFDTNALEIRFIKDTINEQEPKEYYCDRDFRVGGVINCYGRRITLTGCDEFTRNYYITKYKVDDMPPAVKKDSHMKLSGTEKCLVKPKDFITDDKHTKKLMPTKLRFKARLISKLQEDCDREFVISYQIPKNTIAVFEYGKKNSGYGDRQFFASNRIQIPGDQLCNDQVPLYYNPSNMFVGAVLIINDFYFLLLNADEFTFKYMEDNYHEFPKSNIQLIMEKIKTKLKPIYKQFVAEEMAPEELPYISYKKLKMKLLALLGNDFTEHEMITISHNFPVKGAPKIDNREELKEQVLNEIKKNLWDDYKTLKDYFMGKDQHKTGKITQGETYNILRTCRLPFDSPMIKTIVRVVQKDTEGNVYYEDLLDLFKEDTSTGLKEPSKNICAKEKVEDTLIDWLAFNKYLNLEDTLKE